MDAHVVAGVLLNRIEARHSFGDEAEVVGVAYSSNDVATESQILERLEPRIEDRLRRGVPFHVEAVDRPVAGIDVEVHVELVARGAVRVTGEMLRDPRLRSVQSLLLATPEREANRAPRASAHRLEYARGFEDGRRAVGIVGRAGSGVPGVQVSADHHDLVLQSRIGTWNLRDHI